MNVLQWLLGVTDLDILIITALYQLIVIAVFVLFAVRIGHIKTLDDLLPEDDFEHKTNHQ